MLTGGRGLYAARCPVYDHTLETLRGWAIT
jgi:hypothetical protein